MTVKSDTPAESAPRAADGYGEPAGPLPTAYGAVLAGDQLVIVRAHRDVRGRLHLSPAAAAGSAEMARWQKDRLRPDTVVAGCLAVQESLTLRLEAPLNSVAKARKVLPAVLDVQLPFPLEKCCWCFTDIRRRPAGGLQALAVAARRETVQARLESYRRQGADPALLDHEGLALWTRSLEEQPLPPGVFRALIHLEAGHVALVFGRDAGYQGAHNLQTDPQAADPAAELARLAERMRRILRATLPAETPVQWLASGPGAADAQLVAGLQAALAGEWPGPLTVLRGPETFLARALAARAVTRGAWRCNLRAGDLLHPALARRRQRRQALAAARFLAAGLLLCAGSLAWRLSAAQREASLNRAVAELAAALAPGARIYPGQELREVQRRLEENAAQVTPFLEAFQPPLAERLAAVLRAGQAAGTAYETLALRPEQLVLTGSGQAWENCERLAESLRQLGCAVDLERRVGAADQPAPFTLRAASGRQPPSAMAPGAGARAGQP